VISLQISLSLKKILIKLGLIYLALLLAGAHLLPVSGRECSAAGWVF